MLIRIVAALVFMLALSAGHRAEAATGCPLPFILQNGTIPDATQVMADFYALQACIQGGGGGGGTPINLGLTVPPELTVTGSPYTGGSDVFAIGKAAENPSTVWAGPVSGAPQAPTFRQLACADLAGGCGTPSASFSCSSVPGSCPLSVPMFWPGVPPANQVVRISMSDAVTCPAGLSLSEGSARTAATGTPVVGIYQSVGGTGAPTLVATATFTGAVPAFAAASAINLAVGDVIQYQFPASPDATMADVSLTLHCIRTTGFTIGASGSPLPDGNIWVGNLTGVAAPVVPSGDLSMTDTGAFSVQRLNINQTASTLPNPPGPAVYNNISITDSTNVAGAGFKEALQINHTFGGGATGGTQSLTVNNTMTTATSASNTNRNYVAGYFQEVANSPDNGTGGSPAGAFFGVGVQAIACGTVAIGVACPVTTAATNLLELTAGEINIAAVSGSSMKFKGGWTIAATSIDAVQGTTWDCELCLSNQPGAVGWKDGILFGNMNGQYPSSGTLIASTGGSYVNGIDFSLDTISGCALKTLHDCIENGSGGSTINNLTVSGTFTASGLGGNPTAHVGTSAVNGSATTFLRSDGAPAIDQTMSPTWTGVHAFGEVHGTTTTVTLTSNNYNAVVGDCGTTKLLPTGTTPTVTLPNINPASGSCTIVFITTVAKSYKFQAASGGTAANSQAFFNTRGTNTGDTVVVTLTAPSVSAATWNVSGDVTS